MKYDGKKYKFIYIKNSYLSYISQKKKDNEIKLWREINNKIYWIHKLFRLGKNEFRIIGIQVVRQIIHLNIFIRDIKNMYCYYHLYEAEISVQ